MLALNANDYELFKFRGVDERLFRSFVNSEIYFARPERLNDPFDCRVDIGKALENAIARTKEKVRSDIEKLKGMKDFFEQVQIDVKEIGVCSFALKLNDSLMWAHYANNHRGVCLLYRFAESFFFNQDIIGIGRVEYGVDPLTDWFVQWGTNPPLYREWEKFRDDLLVKMLTIKSSEWAAEQEARIVRKPHGVYCIDKQSLVQICFGLQTDAADVEVIRELVKHLGYKVTFCKMERDGGRRSRS